MPLEAELKIKEVVQRTYNVKSFRLESSSETAFKAGQYLLLTINNGRDITKPLTISSSPTETGYIEVTKKITQSEFSAVLNKFQPGDKVKIKYPYGEFVFKDEYKKTAFLCGGIGITPVRSIIRYVVDKIDRKDAVDMCVFYGNRALKDIVFKDDFDVMRGQYQKLKVVHVLSDPEAEWTGEKGYIDKKLIVKTIPDYQERKFYICGPPAMVEAMKKILLKDLFIRDKDIITERFAGYR